VNPFEHACLQGLNCGIEGVRMLNIVLKASQVCKCADVLSMGAHTVCVCVCVCVSSAIQG